MEHFPLSLKRERMCCVIDLNSFHFVRDVFALPLNKVDTFWMLLQHQIWQRSTRVLELSKKWKFSKKRPVTQHNWWTYSSEHVSWNDFRKGPSVAALPDTQGQGEALYTVSNYRSHKEKQTAPSSIISLWSNTFLLLKNSDNTILNATRSSTNVSKSPILISNIPFFKLTIIFLC